MRIVYSTSVICSALLLVACAESPPSQQNNIPAPIMPMPEVTVPSAAEARLGTTWGDEIQSHVSLVDLKRASTQPISTLNLNYADKAYHGNSIEAISLANGQVQLSVLGDDGRKLPLYRQNGMYYLAGKAGQSYKLYYQNGSRQTFEVIASVDGIDVLSGQAASRYHSGYVLYPRQSLTIAGFRKSDAAVASFTFGKPEASYANHSASGNIANTGVIGSVIFVLNNPNADVKPTGSGRYAPEPDAFPADR